MDSSPGIPLLEPWQRELLAECRVARLGTVAVDGRPHLVPVCYALVDETIVIAIDEKPKRGSNLARLRNIARDGRVSFLVDRYDDDWTQLAWLRVDGAALVVANGSERPDALAGLRMRYAQYAAMALESLPLIVISPTNINGWRWQAGPSHRP